MFSRFPRFWRQKNSCETLRFLPSTSQGFPAESTVGFVMRTCGVESGSCSSCGQLDMAKENVKCDIKNLTKKASLRDTSRCKQGNGTFVEMIMIEFKTRPAGVSHWSIVLHCRILLHPNERLHLFGSVIQDSAKVNLVRILSYKHSNPTNGFRMGQGIPRVPVILSNCIIYSKQPLYNNLNFIRFSRM